MRHIEAPHPGAHQTRALATTPGNRPRHPRRTEQEAEAEVEMEVEVGAEAEGHSCRRPHHRPRREAVTERRGVHPERVAGTVHPPHHHPR